MTLLGWACIIAAAVGVGILLHVIWTTDLDTLGWFDKDNNDDFPWGSL